jgi:hypothetical protein
LIKSIYKPKRVYISGLLGWIIIGYLSIVLIIFIVWYFPFTDKGSYRSYKQYERGFDKKLQESVDGVDKYTTLFYTNKINKFQMEQYLKQSSNNLNYLYDSFKWTKGDEVTKELYVIKKQIIIDYAQIYGNRLKAVQKGIKANETDEFIYIKTLNDRYNLKDKLQREKYNLSF